MERTSTEVFLIPFDKLWDRDATTIEDQLWSVRAIVDLQYREAVEAVLAAKQQELVEASKPVWLRAAPRGGMPPAR
jgi:hypothetical protein